MIEQFTKEEFMHQPMEVSIENTYVPFEADREHDIKPQFLEQTIVLHVGGRDYDIRDLIWQLHEAEMRMCELEDRTTRLEHAFQRIEDACRL